jgi:predicted RNA binding protein YcfA (HicA-like mRNA interferase family)
MDLRDIESAAREQGWRVERNKKGHPVFYHPDPNGPAITASGTPSDRRAILNLLALLKKAGLIWPWTAQMRREEKKRKRS